MSTATASTAFINSDHRDVQAFARDAIGAATSPVERARRLFYAVRDRVRYDPYSIDFEPRSYIANEVLNAPSAYCIPKAVLLCAAARFLGIPAMLGFADVRNHLNSEKLQRLLGTDEFVYHGYAALELDGRWVKVTPTFNIELCERFGVAPLEFDGHTDALLHAYDGTGQRHMEYIRDHGLFADLPLDTIRNVFDAAYPGLVEKLQAEKSSRFEDERPLA